MLLVTRTASVVTRTARPVSCNGMLRRGRPVMTNASIVGRGPYYPNPEAGASEWETSRCQVRLPWEAGPVRSYTERPEGEASSSENLHRGLADAQSISGDGPLPRAILGRRACAADHLRV